MATTISRWKYVLYPELRQFEPGRQADALRRASEARFDTIELVGVAVALVMTVLVTRYSGLGMGFAERFGAAISNFVVAIPLLLVSAGPFYVQRTRRALKAQLERIRRSTGKQE